MYKKVCFRIDSGYEWGKGLEVTKIDRFNSEMRSLFTNAGWEVIESNTPGGCDTYKKGKSSLYIHPMELTGPLNINLLKEIEDLLSKATTCELYKIDTYEDVMDWTEEEYLNYLNNKKEKIKKSILEYIIPCRKAYVSDIVRDILRKHGKNTLSNYRCVTCSDDIDYVFVEKLIEELVEEKYLKYTDKYHYRCEITRNVVNSVFKTLEGYELLMEKRKSNITFKIKSIPKDIDMDNRYTFYFSFDENTFNNLVEEFIKAAKSIWKTFNPKEATSWGSDYYEYYDKQYDNNGTLELGKNVLIFERPSSEDLKLYQFNKLKAESFVYDLTHKI